MLEWLKNNLGSMLILLTLVLGVIFLIIGLIKQKKQGKFNCSCNCKNCIYKDCSIKSENNKGVNHEI